MVKVYILLLMTSLVDINSLKGQVFAGGGGQTRGISITGGFMAGSAEVAVTADMALFSTVTPAVYSLTGGYQFLPYGRVSILPFVGVGLVRYKDYTEYNKPRGGAYPQPGPVLQVNDMRKVLGLEVGAQFDGGRLYGVVKYADAFYFGIGIKGYIQ